MGEMDEQNERLVNLAAALARLEDAGYDLQRATSSLDRAGEDEMFETPRRLALKLIDVRSQLADVRSELGVYVGVYA